MKLTKIVLKVWRRSLMLFSVSKRIVGIALAAVFLQLVLAGCADRAAQSGLMIEVVPNHLTSEDFGVYVNVSLTNFSAEPYPISYFFGGSEDILTLLDYWLECFDGEKWVNPLPRRDETSGEPDIDVGGDVYMIEPGETVVFSTQSFYGWIGICKHYGFDLLSGKYRIGIESNDTMWYGEFTVDLDELPPLNLPYTPPPWGS